MYVNGGHRNDRSTTGAARPSGSRSDWEEWIGGGCGLSCTVCDCGRSKARVIDERAWQTGGSPNQLLLRGGTADEQRLFPWLEAGKRAGFREIIVRTSAIDVDVARLRERGVTGVLVPFFSARARVHDALTSREGSLVGALVGMRAFAARGVQVSAEVPLLSEAAQDLGELLTLLHRATPSLANVRLIMPGRGNLPAKFRAPPWSTGGARLAKFFDQATALGVAASLDRTSGVSLCALRDFPEHHHRHRFHPKEKSPLQAGFAFGKACDSCAARAQCQGVPSWYLQTHGETGLTPYRHRPRALYEQSSKPVERWTPERVQARRRDPVFVVRPTVNCNQDCTFCSANETARNLWTHPDEMNRAIARAGHRGLKRLNITGGEPTLSPHLPTFIQVARRTGFTQVDISTNAVLLDKEAKVERLVQAGLTHAWVSLHASSESLSRVLTLKENDFARTVRGIELLVARGVTVTVNHVISERNYLHLEEFVRFVHARYSGRVLVAFTFITPHYKALENAHLIPRISEVLPSLKRAAYRAIDLGQPFFIGARQGIPPCFLGEFRGWSDFHGIFHVAVAEDTNSKVRSKACDACRYTNFCTGLWKAYVARHGLDELEPVPGLPYTLEQLRAEAPESDSVEMKFPRHFGDVPELFRDRASERSLAEVEAVTPERPRRTHLPVMSSERSRPLRLALIGSAGQARKLARAAADVPGIVIDAVVSPHAPDADMGPFGDCPAYRDLETAIDAMKPDGVLIASATHSHLALARLAIAHGLPVLIEKPVTESVQDAEALDRLRDASSARVLPAHNLLFATGLEHLRSVAPPGRAHYQLRTRAGSNDAPSTWAKESLRELLYHAILITRHAARATTGRVTDAQFRGDGIPEWLELGLDFDGTSAKVTLDYTASVTEQTIVLGDEAGVDTIVWKRQGPRVTLQRRSEAPVTLAGEGGEHARMLANFRDVVLGKAVPAGTLRDAVDVKRLTNEAIDRLVERRVPFDAQHAPKRVASRSLARGRW